MRRILALLLLIAGSGCAVLNSASSAPTTIHPFSPTMLSEHAADTFRKFKAKSGGNRAEEARVIFDFLPHCFDAPKSTIDYKKLRFRLGREQLVRMMGPPDAINPFKPRYGFVTLEYKLDRGGNNLRITLYEDVVIDSEMTGVFIYP